MMRDAGKELEASAALGLFEVREAEAKYSRTHNFYTVTYNKDEAVRMTKGIAEREKKDELKCYERESTKLQTKLDFVHAAYNLAVEYRQRATTDWETRCLAYEKVRDVKEGRDYWMATKALGDAEKVYQAATKEENMRWAAVESVDKRYQQAIFMQHHATKVHKGEIEFKKALENYDLMRAKSDSAENEFQMNSLVMGPLYGKLVDAARQAMRDTDAAERVMNEAERFLNEAEADFEEFKKSCSPAPAVPAATKKTVFEDIMDQFDSEEGEGWLVREVEPDAAEASTGGFRDAAKEMAE
jgi:hypothetical protein